MVQIQCVKIEYEGQKIILDSEDQIQITIEHEILESLEIGEEAVITISKVRLTEEEYKELPEFDGF